MKAVGILEDQLPEHWQNLETKKSWDQWKKWLQDAGLSIPLVPKTKIVPSEKINYQLFLSLCEDSLDNHPEWLKKLTTPRWLHEQNIIVLPTNFSSESSQNSLREQVFQLSSDLKKLQQQVIHLESRTNANAQAILSAQTTAGKASSLTPAGNLKKAAIPKHQHLEKELAAHQLSTTNQLVASLSKNEPPHAKQTSLEESSLKKLSDIYLSFNDWCEQFAQNGMNLQEFTTSAIQTNSKRRISFQQFGHRMERKVDNKKLFRATLQKFADMYANGFYPKAVSKQKSSGESPKEKEIPTPQHHLPEVSSRDTFSSEPFQPPSQEMYKKFNDWLGWLREQGIDPHQFISESSTPKVLAEQSNRKISFIQFCRRVERFLDDVEGFRNAIQAE